MRSILVASSLFGFAITSSAFIVQRASQAPLHVLHAFPEDDISTLLERARLQLAKSKAKLEARDHAQASGAGNRVPEAPVKIPFFASIIKFDKREIVTKFRNEKTGLITADGEKMARLSESEAWEMRSLKEVFQNEVEDTGSASKRLANRDVAASIFNLRKSMQTEDYRKIFDSRNRFIGEDN